MDQAKNFAKATVIDGNYDSTATEIDVLAGQGTRFPTPPFNATWWNVTDFADPADDEQGREVVRVTDITDDTLTIIRAQEGTDATDKNLANKAYQLVAGPTAKLINSDIGAWRAANGNIEVDSGVNDAAIGDVLGNGQGTLLTVSDANTKIELFATDILISGNLGTGQSVSATGPAITIVAKVPIFDSSQTLIGYLPIYSSIT